MAKAKMTWEEPPQKNTRGSYASSLQGSDIALQLKKKPGEWAMIAKKATAQQAAMLANYIRQARSSAWAPLGAYEAVSRKVDKEYRVYARFIGDNPE